MSIKRAPLGFLHRQQRALVVLVVMISVVVICCTISNSLRSADDDPTTERPPECRCSSEWSRPNDPDTSSFFKGHFKQNSTCSDQRTHSRTNQNVVSYSLYLPHNQPEQEIKRQLYLEGIQRNLEAMRKYYPGYSMRIYTNEYPDVNFCNLICTNKDLYWCDIRETPSLGDQSDMFYMTWRFLVLGDPTVDVFLSRDLDSVITAREAAVVKDWLESKNKKAIHVMRDKDVHKIPMPGGMWGARNSLLRNKAVTLQGNIVEASSYFRLYGADQVVLKAIVYNSISADIVAYDSYHCITFRKHTLVRPFPTQRHVDKNGDSSDFVGNVDLGEAKYPFRPCPEECRPSFGKNWTFC